MGSCFPVTRLRVHVACERWHAPCRGKAADRRATYMFGTVAIASLTRSTGYS
jgi:hypothetical protein